MSETDHNSHLSDRKRFRWKRIVALVLAILLVPPLLFRISSFSRKIRVVSDVAAPPTAEMIIADAATPADALPQPQLTIATWNIAHGRGNTDSNLEAGGAEKRERIQAIAEEIAAFHADIVVLNEVDFCCSWSGGQNQALAIAQASGFPYVAMQSNLDVGLIYGRWWFGNAILSRHPIKDATVIPIAPYRRWENWLVGSKRGLLARISMDETHSFDIAALHLESRGEEVRVRQIDNVITSCRSALAARTAPLIIAGDLNTTLPSLPNSATDASGVNAMEKLITASGLATSPEISPTSFGGTFPADTPDRLIDWILFTGEQFSLRKSEIINSQLSDHRPVVTTLQWKRQ